MNRFLIVVGDAPACGGAVLPYEGTPISTILEHRIALVGGRVFCVVCQSVGLIAKAGGPYRVTFCGAEQALEGDVVVCRCPVPSPLVASRQRFSTCDDRGGVAGDFVPESLGAGWYRADPQALTASKKAVDGLVQNLPEADGTKTICPGMSDADFFAVQMNNRNRAVNLIRRKIRQLTTWNAEAKTDLETWFGCNDDETRRLLLAGLTKTVEVLKGLTGANFARYSDEFEGRIECIKDSSPGVVAGVCKTDIKNRVIGIAHAFCSLRLDSGRGDSQVGTLIHEVSHFQDVFDSYDLHNGFESSMKSAKKLVVRKYNADSITGYVMWETNFET